ncbi:MAG: 1-hydroxycarotenoid 3,4-desaturase CrtD [Ferruginibacter sp.]
MHRKKIIIIGSGIAALAASIRLSVQGFAVEIYEKNDYAGGKMAVLEKDGYRFDYGPSLFTQPKLVEEIFSLAGEDIYYYLKYRKIEVACNYFFADGKNVTGYSDVEKFAAEMNEKLGENKDSIKKYLGRSAKLYNRIAYIFLNYSLHRRSTWLHARVLKALGALRISWLTSTLGKYNKKNFSTLHARQLFDRYATYNGSNPYQAPAMLSVIPHLEFNEGTWYPVGGLRSVAEALFNLARYKGVKFHLNCPAERIIHVDGEARGIVCGGENIFADAVISNADIYFTYQDLLQDTNRAAALLKQERSSSAMIFYWGISKQFDALGLHNIFFSADYRKEFNDIFIHKKLPGDPTVYINITAEEEPGHAPGGCGNWFVMINVPANAGQPWEEWIVAARKKIIEIINERLDTDIENFIETEIIKDPRNLEMETGSFMGSLYGTSSNSRLAAFFRHPNESRAIKNLYFCGGSVHPGGGIPLCLHSAKIVAECIAGNKTLHTTHDH